MRVANVIEEGKLGGPQVRMVRVAASLGDRADTLIVMPCANSGPFREICEAHGVPYRALPLTRITKEWRAALAYVLFSPWELLRLARLFRRERIDLVHASGGSWQYKAVIAAWLAGVPSVWHLNDTSAPVWVRFLFRMVQPLANGYIFASGRSQEYYGGLICVGRPQAVVPSAVSLECFAPSQDFPTDPDLPLEGPVIGTVANVNPVKGLETLIRATARLRSLGHTPKVVILGAIPDRQSGYHRRLQVLAHEQGVEDLYFIGARSDVRPVLAQLDIYICCSVAESSPVSVWEAMAMACPVVSTDVGDVSRYVHNGREGFIVPVGDDTAMADGISQLLDDPERRIRMGKAARAAAQAFKSEEIARLTLGIYKRIRKARLKGGAPEVGSDGNKHG